MSMEKKRLAVLVGCNYANTQHELHGCINDVHSMRDLLIEKFGFESEHINVLTDAPESSLKPTGANIKVALNHMIARSEAGDVLFFHFSGHGTRFPSKVNRSRKEEEAIVPCDFNLITDVDFRQLVNRIPNETSFTVLSDSCHSGGLIDKEKEQIGPSSINPREKTSSSHPPPAGRRPKTIPYESILQHLTHLTGINTADLGTHLITIFGEEVSAKFKVPVLQRELDSLHLKPHPDAGILLSGCQADETSADMPGSGAANLAKAYGAFSNAVQEVFKANQGPLSNTEAVMSVRKILKEKGARQHPCLYCSDQNAKAPFLWQPDN